MPGTTHPAQPPAQSPTGSPGSRRRRSSKTRPSAAQGGTQPLAFSPPPLPVSPLLLPDFSTLPHYLIEEDLQQLIDRCMAFIAHPDFPAVPLLAGMDAQDYLRAGIRHAVKVRIPESHHPGVVFEFTGREDLRLGFHITADQAEWFTVHPLTETYGQLDPRIVPSLIRHLQDHSHFCGPVYTPKNTADFLDMYEDCIEVREREDQVRQQLADERNVDPDSIDEAEVKSRMETDFMTSKKIKVKHPEWFVPPLTLEELKALRPEDALLQEAARLLERLQALDQKLRDASVNGDIELPTLEDWHCHSYVFCIVPTLTIGYTNIFYEMFEEEMRDWGEGLAPYFVGEVTDQGITPVLETLSALEEARKVQHQLLHLLTEESEWMD